MKCLRTVKMLTPLLWAIDPQREKPRGGAAYWSGEHPTTLPEDPQKMAIIQGANCFPFQRLPPSHPGPSNSYLGNHVPKLEGQSLRHLPADFMMLRPPAHYFVLSWLSFPECQLQEASRFLELILLDSHMEFGYLSKDKKDPPPT